MSSERPMATGGAFRRAVDAAERFGLKLTDKPPRPGEMRVYGFPVEPDPDMPKGLWQVRNSAAVSFDTTKVDAWVREWIRKRYAEPTRSWASWTDPDTKEGPMAPRNPYRDAGSYADAGGPAPMKGTFDLAALDTLLAQRYREGRADGYGESVEESRRQFARVHDEGYEAGQQDATNRRAFVLDTRLRAAATLAEKVTQDRGYGEEEVLRVLAVVGATCRQLLRELGGEDGVLEHRPVPVPPLEADEGLERIYLAELEAFLRDRLPERLEPIADPPTVPIEVEVNLHASPEDVERAVRDALQARGDAEA